MNLRICFPNLFSNGIRESVVVTKIFDIKLAPSDHAPSDEYENKYLYELQEERKVKDFE
jgi:hypothetical protein